MSRGFPIFPLATLPTRALFTAILLRWRMGYHVAAADKRRIALLSNYEAIPASIKAAASGYPASAASRSIDEKHFSFTGRLQEPLPSPSKYLGKLGRDSPYSSSGMALLIVARFRDILESSQREPARDTFHSVSFKFRKTLLNKKK